MSSSPTVSPSKNSASSLLLGVLCAGGFLASLWALFQWGELLVARAGGTPFCAISEVFNCSAVWDSSLARAVHTMTLVPIAGWGLMWGIVAFALPLVALVDQRRLGRGVGTALRINALVGVLSVGGLAAASFVAGAVCIGCIGTYILVAAWAVAAFMGTKSTGFTEPKNGVFWAGGLTVAAYIALVGPGNATPHALADLGKNAIANAPVTNGNAPNTPAKPDTNPGVDIVGPFDGPSTGDPGRDQALADLLAQLPPEAKQIMSNLLADYDAAPAGAVPPSRARLGDANAVVKLVDWTDPLCPHCAELHSVIDEIKKATPPGTVSVEPHFFPLDGSCNPSVNRKGETGEVRCTATKALICLESDPEKLSLAQKLIFDNQAGLSSVEKVFETLKPLVEKKALDACMASAETQKKLDVDIEFATKNHLEGTPLVLLNGKEVKPFGPILYALTLTGGKTKTQAFKNLPAPKAPAPQ